MNSIDIESLKRQAMANGWVDLAFSSDASLHGLALAVGGPVASRRGGPVAEVVLSLSSERSHPYSLSRRYGKGCQQRPKSDPLPTVEN
jgi:hypothetical protein